MLTPFLFEIRSVIDWMFTPTTLTFSEWIRIEAIHAQVYQIKCLREFATWPLRSQKQANWRKLLLGGAIASLLVAILWFPLFLFAYSSALGQPNPPHEVFVSFQIGNYEAAYNFEATLNNIHQFTELDYKKVSSLYDKHESARHFIGEYEAEDVVAIVSHTNSSTFWNVSPPNAKQMISEIKSGELKRCQLSYKISRPAFAQIEYEMIRGATDFLLEDQKVRDQLVAILESEKTLEPIEIPNIFPKFLNALNNGKFRDIPKLFLNSHGKISIMF